MATDNCKTGFNIFFFIYMELRSDNCSMIKLPGGLSFRTTRHEVRIMINVHKFKLIRGAAVPT